MIYLIGGPPRCGKTKLSQKLSQVVDVDALSVDELEAVIRPYISNEDYPKLFPKNIIRENTSNSNDLMYEKYSPENIFETYLRQGETLHPAIEAIIESAIRTKKDLIIEGYHLTPCFVFRMKEKYDSTNIRAIFLTKSDFDDALETIRASKDTDDWVHTKTKNQNTHHKIAEFIVLYSRFFVKECKNHKINCSEYNGSLTGHLDSALKVLLG